MNRDLTVTQLLCIAFILAGCGDNGGGNESVTNPTAAQTTSGTDGASETGAGTTVSVDPSKPTEGSSGDPTTTTGSVGSTGDATATTFIVLPDMPFGGEGFCDVFKQDCKNADDKCVAWAEGGGGAWNATKCVKETGKKIAGDVCMAEGGGASGIDDCAKGNMCWNVNGKNQGICVALCTGTAMAPKCDPGFACDIANDGVLNLCLPTCDPLLQDCDGADLCIPNLDGFVCVPDASGDGGKQNEPCEFHNRCDKGLACLPTATASSACMQDSQGCCSQFCDVSKMEPCPNPDQKCVAWFDPMMPIPPGFEDVGVCSIPA
ncbi:MAG: ribulose phosphate epimerase [Nannocystis sp.]|uniref:ribulose phosphate epimerase n=1 Tax=Nannocystis sp. TaxID=1962667 RepID=UPI002429DDE6|nr:ribulose phosphate epimerase [Nannocystis sp.]MBK9752744.1 ribulose phosphate epimerase [Nannocystis sp.]